MDAVTRIRCACGAVEVHLEGEPMAHFYCHCDDCQMVHGAPMIGVAAWPRDKLRFTGPVKEYVLKTLPRFACATCGMRIFASPRGAPFHGVIATLLPTGTFKPMFHLQCQHATVRVNDGLPHYKAWPPAFGGSDETVDW